MQLSVVATRICDIFVDVVDKTLRLAVTHLYFDFGCDCISCFVGAFCGGLASRLRCILSTRTDGWMDE